MCWTLDDRLTHFEAETSYSAGVVAVAAAVALAYCYADEAEFEPGVLAYSASVEAAVPPDCTRNPFHYTGFTSLPGLLCIGEEHNGLDRG